MFQAITQRRGEVLAKDTGEEERGGQDLRTQQGQLSSKRSSRNSFDGPERS